MVFWGPLLLTLGYLYLAQIPDLRLAVPRLILVSGLQVGLLGFLLWKASQGRFRLNSFEILFWAALFRLLFLPHPPSLSDDLYRYLWDGARVAAGENPYALPPEAFFGRVGGVLSEILSRVNHPHLVTIYPPGAQLLFGLFWKIFPSHEGFRAFFLLFDLGSVLFLTRLSPFPGIAIAYAWHPLPVLETASSGHLEAVMGFFLLGAFWFLKKKRAFFSGLFNGVAFAVKLLPAVFFPFFLREAKGKKARRAFSGGVFLGAFFPALLFLKGLPHLLETLKVYGLRWEFSGLLYEILRPLFGNTEARGLLLLSFLGLIFWIYRERFPLKRSLCLSALAFLLTTPTLHPWYVLFFLIWLPLDFSYPGLILGWAALLPYFVLPDYALHHVWQENHLMTLILFATTLIAFLSYLKGFPSKAITSGLLRYRGQRARGGEKDQP